MVMRYYLTRQLTHRGNQYDAGINDLLSVENEVVDALVSRGLAVVLDDLEETETEVVSEDPPVKRRPGRPRKIRE